MKKLYLCLYLIAMMALLSIIVTTNVLAMEKTKQDNMMDWMQNLLSDLNNLLFRGILIYLYPLRITIREISVTIWNMFVPLVILSALGWLVWSWWFSNGKFLRMKQDSGKGVPSSPSHGYNLRDKRQKNFILNEK